MTADERVAIDGPTHRLIPSRFPPIGAFDDVASPGDLAAVMELEGWTNDRLVAERLKRLPESEWVYGRANASVVMASFLHTPPTGLRFSSGALGAWYGAMRIETAVAEVGHHLRRELVASRMNRFTATYRAYGARLDGRYLDIRDVVNAPSGLYSSSDYGAAQAFGEAARARGEDGLFYASLRHRGGENICAYRPSNILDVTQAGHIELTLRRDGPIIARRLA